MAPFGVLRKCTFSRCDHGALSGATPTPTMPTATAALVVRTALSAAITGQDAAEQACDKGSSN
jgi:hypothetical protein